MFAIDWIPVLRRLLFTAAIPALVAVTLFAAACGGGGDDDSSDAEDEPTAEATEDSGDDDSGDDDGDDDGEPAEPETVTVGETFWHSGFEVTVDTATIETEETGVFTEETTYYATLEMTIENLGEDTWTFSPEMALTSGGDTHTQQTFDNDIPEVPGGLSSEGTVTFVVDEEFSLDDATLIVGSGDEQRAFVPLGPQGDDLVALEPQPQAIAGQIAMELITLDFTDGETRADFPRFHSEQDDGSLVLNLNFTATSRTSGNWNIFDADFALTKPDGTSVTVDSSTLGSIPGSDAGITTPDLSITFDVDDPAAGEYTLIFTPGSWFVADGGATEGQFVFTVE